MGHLRILERRIIIAAADGRKGFPPLRAVDSRQRVWSNPDMRTSGPTVRAVLLGGILASAAAGQDRPWIGVAVSDGVDGAPVRVIRVFPDSPAEKMGLREGDVIAAVDGRPVRTSQDLVDYVRSRPPGAALQLDARRGDKAFRAATTLAALPERYTRFQSGPSRAADAAPPGWADIVNDAFGRQREQLNRFQEKLGELAAEPEPAADTRLDVEWLRHETEATRDQALRLESLLRQLEPRSKDPAPADFDPRRLILRGGAELGDSIQVLLSDPETGRQFLLREGDVVHGYTVSGIVRTEQDLLLIRLRRKDEEVVELIESGL